MDMPAEQPQALFPNNGQFLGNSVIALVDISLIKQEAMSRPEAYQKAVRRIGILKDTTRHFLPDTGPEGIRDEEIVLLQNVFTRLLGLSRDVESLLPAYMILVEEDSEQYLQSLLRTVRTICSLRLFFLLLNFTLITRLTVNVDSLAMLD